jgi:hypothetical protein
MKRYGFFLLLFVITAVAGCIKDDNPYPEIQNTTWKRTFGESWERVSFSAGRVHHEIYFLKDSVTIDSTDFYADYKKETEDNRHMFSWISPDGNIKYRVFSLGPDNVVIGQWPYGEGPWIGMNTDGQLYYRDEDPAEGYNF